MEHANDHTRKTKIYDQLARVGKAIASGPRLELLDLLVQAERSVDALAQASELSVTNASQHLQILHAARLIENRRDGQRIFYRLADDEVGTFWRSLRKLAETRLTELHEAVEAYLEHKNECEAIDRRDLVRRLHEGSVVLIDVRPREEFEFAHIRGAVSVPVPELERWARDLGPNKEVVAYCRGPYCVMAVEAVARLSRRGIPALRLEDGVGEWRAAGLPVEGPAVREARATRIARQPARTLGGAAARTYPRRNRGGKNV